MKNFINKNKTMENKKNYSSIMITTMFAWLGIIFILALFSA